MTQESPQDRYRRLVDQSGVGLFETSVEGAIHWVNPAAARIVGYDSPQEFIATVSNIRELYVHPELRDEFVRRGTDSGKVSDFEYEIWHKTGAVRWISVSSQAIRDDTEAVIAFEGTVMDITERKLIEAASSAIASGLQPDKAVTRFARVLQRVVPFRQLSLVVIEADAYRRVVSVAGDNAEPLKSGERVPLAGNSVEAVVSKVETLIVQDTNEGRWDFDSKLAAAGVGSYAIFPLVEKEEVFATLNIGMPVAGAFSDDLVRLLGTLVGSAAQSVRNILLFERERAAVERLEKLDELKNDLIANVAHDLKTPLAAISGLTTLLRAHVDEWTPTQRAEAIGGIARSVDRISRRVRQDLNVAMIEADQVVYNLKELDMAALVIDAVSNATILGTVHEFSLAVPADLPTARGDEERNLQILDNLIGNAIKFAPKGSRIEVGAHDLDAYVEVWVSDEGPGIAEEDIPKLFKKMGRLLPQGGSTGLGLYICKALVEGQGGSITVGPSASGGARFAYTLPRFEPAA